MPIMHLCFAFTGSSTLPQAEYWYGQYIHFIRAVTSYGAGGAQAHPVFVQAPPAVTRPGPPRFSHAPQFVSGTAVELAVNELAFRGNNECCNEVHRHTKI